MAFHFDCLVALLLFSTVGTTAFALPKVDLGMESVSSVNE